MPLTNDYANLRVSCRRFSFRYEIAIDDQQVGSFVVVVRLLHGTLFGARGHLGKDSAPAVSSDDLRKPSLPFGRARLVL